MKTVPVAASEVSTDSRNQRAQGWVSSQMIVVGWFALNDWVPVPTRKSNVIVSLVGAALTSTTASL